MDLYFSQQSMNNNFTKRGDVTLAHWRAYVGALGSLRPPLGRHSQGVGGI